MKRSSKRTYWVQGDGHDLPHGTVCIVLFDDEPFLREAHPLTNGQVNWWPLTGRRGEMIPGEEVTAYCITGPLPTISQPK